MDFNCKEGLRELPSANQKMLITSKGDNRADKIKNWIFYIILWRTSNIWRCKGICQQSSPNIYYWQQSLVVFFSFPTKTKWTKALGFLDAFSLQGEVLIFFFNVAVSKVFLMSFHFKWFVAVSQGGKDVQRIPRTFSSKTSSAQALSDSSPSPWKARSRQKHPRQAELESSLAPGNALGALIK